MGEKKESRSAVYHNDSRITPLVLSNTALREEAK